MCIVVISTEHPLYPLILVNNRDEFLSRPTAPAAWWDAPHGHVLGGRDRLRAARGTWLGVTRDGRVAVLTNFHEPDPAAAQGLVSRGEMVNAFLQPPPGPGAPDGRGFAEALLASGPEAPARGAGGFSLVCGRAGQALAVASNRMAGAHELGAVAASGQTVALSNAAFGDRSWPKVARGEELLRAAVARAAAEGTARDELVSRLLDVLDADEMPPAGADQTLHERAAVQRLSVFIPVRGDRAEVAGLDGGGAEPDSEQMEKAASGAYGTRQQTVVLVDKQGSVTYVERTLFDDGAGGGAETRRFDFQIED